MRLHEKIQKALDGDIDIDELSEEERHFFNEISKFKLNDWSMEEIYRFEQCIMKNGSGVGLDKNGYLITADGMKSEE